MASPSSSTPFAPHTADTPPASSPVSLEAHIVPSDHPAPGIPTPTHTPIPEQPLHDDDVLQEGTQDADTGGDDSDGSDIVVGMSKRGYMLHRREHD